MPQDPDPGHFIPAERRGPQSTVAGFLFLLMLPLVIRLPSWFTGLSSDPIWTAAQLVLPGSLPRPAGLPGFLDIEAGWTTQALGGLAARQWLAGQIPWWDPFSGIGMPLAAEMQSSALFLPFVLLLALPGGLLLLMLSLQWTAGLATWFLLRRLGLGGLAATTGAAAFELCSAFAWMGPPLSLPVAFLPLFLLGIERAREENRSWRLIAAAVALSLYAGFPETAYLDGLLALLWAAIRLTQQPRGRRAGFSLRVALGGVVGLLLAAPLLWPFFDLLSQASLGDRDTAAFAALRIPVEGASVLLTPYALGLPAGLTGLDPTGRLLTIWARAGGYLGMALALATVLGGLVPGPERRLRLVLLAWVALFVARVAGLPAAEWPFRLMPFHDQVQVYRYAEAAWLLPCCILAAFAVRGAVRAPRVWLAAGALLAVALAALAWAWPLVQGVTGATKFLIAAAAWGTLSLLAAGFAFARGGARTRAAVLLADMAVLAAAPQAAGYRHPELDFPAIGFLQGHIGLQRFATLGPFQPNYGALFGVASVNHNYLPLPALWAGHVGQKLRPGATLPLFLGDFPPDRPGMPTNAEILAGRLPAYAALGVRYVLAPSGTTPFRAPGPPVRVYADPILDIYELVDPAPYFAVQGGPCRWTAFGRIALDVVCDAPARLIRRELMFPGWRVTIDGGPARLVPEDTLFQSVVLPAGRLRVEFRYVPPGAAAFMTLFASGVLLLLPWRRFWRRSGASRSRNASIGSSTA